MSTANPSSTIIPSATLGARSSAIFILKPWLPLVALARLEQEHSSCMLGTSSSPSSLGAKKPTVERRKPIVTELALADALDQLVNLIEELRADANLRVQITTDETDLVKITFSGTPDVGFPLQREDTRHSCRDRSPCLERGPPRLRHPVSLRRRRLRPLATVVRNT